MQFFPTPKHTDVTDPMTFFRGNQGREQDMPEFAPILEAVREESSQHGRKYVVQQRPQTGAPDQPVAGNDIKPDAGANQRLSREDFAALEASLKEHGLSEDEVQSLLDEVESSKGLTWKELAVRVVELLQEDDDRPVLLDTNEKRQLQVFLQKLGILPQEAESLVDGVDSPEGRKDLWEAIQSAVENMSDETLVNMSAQELSILGKSLGMTGGAFKTLDKILTADGTAPVLLEGAEVPLLQKLLQGAEAMDGLAERLLGAAGKAVALTARELKGLKQVLSENLADAGLLQKLFAAADGEKLDGDALRMVFGMVRQTQLRADVRADDNLKSLLREIRDVWQGSLARTEFVSQGESKDLARAIQGNAAAKVVAVMQGEDAKSVASSVITAQAGNVDAKVSGKAESQDISNLKDQGQNQQGLKDQALQSRAGSDTGSGERWSSPEGQTSDDPVAEFWKKIEVKPGVKSNTNNSFDPQVMQQVVADQVGTQATTTGQRKVNVHPPEVSRSVFKMVENGILQNLGQGRKQLTLRLSPPELGALTVMLNVRNKDVQAVIRTGSEEAGRIVGEQLAQLRLSLEQQGLRVNRLEVQTQLKEELAGQNWLGAEEHNQAWQQQQQFDGLGWIFKWLGIGRGDVEDPAQEVQVQTEQERISSEGLDIFA